MSEAIGLVAALLVLAVVDGAFAGFRAGAGRTSLVRPWRRGYYPRFVIAGAVASVVCQVPAAVVGAIVVDAGDAAAVARVATAATALLQVAGLYAAVVVAAMVVWLIAGVEGRTLASVSVLGPFTLIRPFVIVLALGRVVVASSMELALTFALGCAGVLLVEPIVSALRRPRGA